MFISKFFTLVLPLLFFVTLSSLVLSILQRVGVNEFLWGQGFVGFWQCMKDFLTNGSIHAQFLGACWFIVILAEAFLLEKILLIVTGNCNSKISVVLFCLLTIIQTIFGYYNIANDYIYIPNYRLTLIAGSIVAWGIIAYRIKHKFRICISMRMIVLIVNIVIMFIVAKYFNKTVDLASCRVNSLYFDFFMQMNGIIFIIQVSFLICTYLKFLVPCLTYVGRNTMGILIGHFLVFKFCFLYMETKGIISFEDVSRITPTTEIGNEYWIIISILGIVVPLLIWELIKQIPILSFLIGERKEQYQIIKEKIMTSKPVRIFDKIEEKIIVITKNKIIQYVGVGICVMYLCVWMVDYYDRNYSDAIEFTGTKCISESLEFDEQFYQKSDEEKYIGINYCGTINIEG